MIRFNANLYRIAFTCSSNKETRYYLKGVYVEPHALGGVTLTATDGHRIIVIRDETGHADESAIINLGDGLKQCKPKRDERRDVVIHTGSNDANIVSTIAATEHGNETLTDMPIATTYAVKVDGTYPDYRRVVPQTFNDKGAPGFQGRYIAAFGDVATELAAHLGRKPAKYSQEESRADVVRILCSEDKNPEGCPALVLFSAFDSAFGILMPCRLPKGSPADVPAWFRAKPVETAQAAE